MHYFPNSSTFRSKGNITGKDHLRDLNCDLGGGGDSIIYFIETGCVGMLWCAVVCVQQWPSVLSAVAKFMDSISISEGYHSRSWLNL